ncbi:hypothetical protein EMCG_05948 [[Emmonsia] crescens]|uniref:Uncharacterized protein n=1 Tax=[Emmonsia] crescens TaxID=73230 RepID=A0A0G2ICX1_9EURO|nr:hypothetical protein EMCG_05948 [Emmonsia crescens UAMH 3008]
MSADAYALTVLDMLLNKSLAYADLYARCYASVSAQYQMYVNLLKQINYQAVNTSLSHFK